MRAKRFLQGKGYDILEQNFRIGRGELDLICMDKEEIVFIEVKTRQTSYFGQPFLSVTRKKQQQLVKLADHYMKKKDVMNEARFDVISIVLNRSEYSIEHIENAFVPML